MENKLGALWLKDSKKGTKYMSGVIEKDGEKFNIVVFKNNNKKQDNHPDYEIYLSEPREQKSTAQAVKETFEDDIPF